ncbi:MULTISPECIES: exostosin family protein [Flavobacterium]|uniref:Exostosin family protein n=2 Tax=Flavobacterium TaxID=237 RepID=A0A2N9PDY8_9FLAO|nr:MULTISPECIES: exostosin family protein [Flavobacterium]QYS89415.1 exostosin family protein [Flavobacterium davisii]RVU91831.1 hypothetical protein EH230_02310 [Flavobacterium columnare]SPE78551.1 Exostosin family protein [Flavobacterium columnare]
MITFYTNTKTLIPANRKIVFPLLFDVFYLKNPVAISNFYFQDEPDRADIHIFPLELTSIYNSGKRKDWFDFLDEARKLNKIVWVYTGGDFGITLPFNNNLYTFRLGGFNSKLDTNTHVIPSFINDPISVLGLKWFIIEKNIKPSVGFVGHSNGSFSKIIKEFLIYTKHQIKRSLKIDKTDYQFFYPSSNKRFHLLEVLKNASNIDTKFIYRAKYRAGANSQLDKVNTTLEFFKNIQENLYTFCMRGSGNFSVRFYETLIMGRIPIILDTDIRLPLHDKINWEKHCIIVKENDCIQKIIEFHESKTNEELKNIQYANRQLMLNKLNRIDYFFQILD